MTLNFQITSWVAETPNAVATIFRTGGERPFAWEIYSKLDGGVVTDGHSDTLGQAKQAATRAATAIE